MDKYIHQLLFGYYPYIVLVVFVTGSIMRYRSHQETWNVRSTQFLSRRGMGFANNLFHITIILLLFSHLFGLLTAKWIYSAFITPETKQWLAMTIGGTTGFLCFISMTFLVYRRFTDSRVLMVQPKMDNCILLLIYFTLFTGLLTITVSAEHPKGKAMVALSNWAQHIATFRGTVVGVSGVDNAADFIYNHSILFKAHILCGLTIFLLFPFSSLIHIFSVPIRYLFRKSTQIVRKRG